jgi:hypothetical protein
MIKFIIEVLVVFIIAYGIWREDDLVEWEDRIFEKIKTKSMFYELDAIEPFTEEEVRAFNAWWDKRN